MTLRERYRLQSLRVDLPAELYQRIEAKRKALGVSRRSWLIEAITRHLTAEAPAEIHSPSLAER